MQRGKRVEQTEAPADCLIVIAPLDSKQLSQLLRLALIVSAGSNRGVCLVTVRIGTIPDIVCAKCIDLHLRLT